MHIRMFGIAGVMIALAAPALAQTPKMSVAVKGGVTAENSEDNLTGTVPAVGAGIAWHVTPHWRAEFEVWLPGYLEDARGEPKHRDILFTTSAIRSFGSGTARPFLAAGFSFARTEDWFTFCTAERPPQGGGAPVRIQVSCDAPDVVDRRRELNAGSDGYISLGGGVEIALRPGLQLVADVRVSVAPVSVLVRPSLGVAWTF